jgi:hypothetical protein
MSNKSDPVARPNFVNMIQSTVTDLAQQYELIAMYDAAYPAAALTAGVFGSSKEWRKLLDRTEPYISYNDGYGSPAYMEFKDNKRKFHAAITKLTNLESGS